MRHVFDLPESQPCSLVAVSLQGAANAPAFCVSSNSSLSTLSPSLAVSRLDVSRRIAQSFSLIHDRNKQSAVAMRRTAEVETSGMI